MMEPLRQSGPEQPICMEQYRQYHENDKHWEARREFLARHMHHYPGHKMDQLIALSVVWSNIVFIGNRYGEQLTQKVHQMGEGIDIGEVPSYELVPGAKSKKRSGKGDIDNQPPKKMTPRFGPRPRFEPVHFVVSSSKDDNTVFETKIELDNQKQEQYDGLQASDDIAYATVEAEYEDSDPEHQPISSPVVYDSNDPNNQPPKKITPRFGPQARFGPVHFVVSSSKDDNTVFETKIDSDNQEQEQYDGFEASDDIPYATVEAEYEDPDPEHQQISSPVVYDSNDPSKGECGNFMSKIEQNYSAKFESHSSTMSKDFRTNVLDVWNEPNKRGRKGIGFINPIKKFSRFGSKGRESTSLPGSITHIPDKSSFIKHLSAIVIQNMLNPQISSESARINYSYMLSRSIQACKTNPEYIYVPLKGIPPVDLPRHRKFPIDGFACEVRCQDIYLATGYSGSKNGARDRAAENAIKVLQKNVDVITVTRKFGHTFRDDLVACPRDIPIKQFPPALKQQDDGHNSDGSPPGQHVSHQIKTRVMAKPWTDFVITENASDAIGILNNSALFNRMVVEYKYDVMPNSTWRCKVYVQDHYVAEGCGNKKTSKHAAAEEAVRILKQLRPNMEKTTFPLSMKNNPIRELNDVVIYENASNPVCTLNDTAQFNKVSVEYVFEKLAGINWKCKVFMEQQFIAEAIGVKKTVKHDAAQEAVMALKRTQPVMINNLKNGPMEDAISRNQIRGRSTEEAYKQQIREDNIGNQLLRKMGWTGGGLGKEGEGIAEPIAVKEQFSREGLGLTSNNQKITKREIEQIIRNYAASHSQDDLTFSRELTNDERKYIHQISQKYGLKSKSHGQGTERFLVVSRKRNRQELIDQLRQGGQVGSYALVMPRQNEHHHWS
ncbi:NF-kappa-B-repressing factor [Discoglossus pictus]